MKHFIFILIMGVSIWGFNPATSSQNSAEEWIYYSGIETGSSEVYRIHPDGSNPQQLTFDSGEDYFQSISPDGQWLIIQSIEGENYYLYRIGLETGQTEQLTFADSRFESWSPDGKTFLYTVFDKAGEKLWQMDWSDFTTHLVINVNHSFPHWSPDGQWIIFVKSADGNLYRIKPDGNDLNAITQLQNPNATPQGWSPDGQWLIFGAWETSTQDFHLYRVKIDGTELAQLTFQFGLQHRIAWTPDGNWIIYHNNLKQPGTALKDIYRILPNGSNNEQLITGDNNYFLGFSPKGKWIYWSSSGEPNLTWGSLYEFDPETKDSRLLTASELIDFPNLSPDGQWITFHTFEDEYNLYIARIDYNERRLLVSGEKRHNFQFWQK